MKTTMIAMMLLWIAAAGGPAVAQEERPRPHGRSDRVERMERLKQMRMIEALELGEDEAVRLMAKRKEHEDRIRGLTEERNAFLDGLGDEVGPLAGSRERRGEKSAGKPAGKSAEKEGAAPDPRAVERSVDRILEQDRKIFDERRRFQDDVRQMLGPEKFARMLLFEREFQMQLRDAMGRSMNRRSQKFDE